MRLLLNYFLIIFVIFSANSNDLVWKIENIPNIGPFASINGRVTWGDTLNIRPASQDCEFSEIFFSVYTTLGNKNIFDLKDKIIGTNFNSHNAGAKVISVNKFLLGHHLHLSYGMYPSEIDFFKKVLFKNKKSISIKLIDANEIIIDEYFDISYNNWNISGFEEAYLEVLKLCKNN